MPNQSDDITTLINKVHAFCGTRPQDFTGRQSLSLSDDEETKLHQLAWLGIVPLTDYYEFQHFKLADNLWHNPKAGLPRFRTIDQIRAWVQWRETRQFVTERGHVTETVFIRFLPSFRYIRRTIRQTPNKALFQTISHIEEVEFADLRASMDFDTAWKKLIQDMQTNAVEHFKWSVQDALSAEQTEHLQQLVLLSKADVQLIYILSQGTRKETKCYSLLEAYQPLIEQAIEEVTRVQVGKAQEKRKTKVGPDDLIHDTSAKQLEDILAVLRKAFLTWDPLRAPLPAWVQFKLGKETQGLSHHDYQPSEQKPEKRADAEGFEVLLDNERGKRRSGDSFLPSIDPTLIPIPVPLEGEDPEDLQAAVKNAMQEVMIRELGALHYQRRFVDGLSAAEFAKELGSNMNRNSIAKREERARRDAFTELTTKFGPNIGQHLFGD
ncbi:MAG: sigma-70 family RNA polymerase sigma factor [Nitrospira sp.]